MALYDAFISYSHAKDKPIAAALQSVVQKLGKPWYRRRALRVFRDDTSLSATPHLWPSIERALGESRYFILLVSPEAAASKWVNKEVVYWLDHNSIDTLLIGVTDGDLTWDESNGAFTERASTSLPPVITRRFLAEPKWVDLRPYRDGADKAGAKFTELAADFAATIHGMPKEDLLSQEVRQQRKALTLAYAGVATLAALIVVAGWQWSVAVRNERAATEQKQLAQEQRDRAVAAESVATQQRQVAEQQTAIAKSEATRAERNFGAAKSTIDAVIFDLAEGLKDIEGMRVETVRRILGQAEAAVSKLASRMENDPAVQRSQGAMFGLFSNTYLRIGATEIAAQYAQKAVNTFRSLATREPTEAKWQRDLAHSLYQLGYVREQQDDFSKALPAYRESLDVMRALAAREPNNTGWKRSVAMIAGSAGEVLTKQGDFKAALSLLHESLDMFRALATEAPNDVRKQRDLYVIQFKVSDALLAQGDLGGALNGFREGLKVIRALSALDQDNTQWRRDIATSVERVGDVLRMQGDLVNASAAYREGVDIMGALATKDPENTEWQRDLSLDLEKVGQVKQAQEDLTGAIVAYREALDIGRRLAAKDRLNTLWQTDVVTTLMRLASCGDDPRGRWSEALTILNGLASEGRLTTAQVSWINQIEAELAKPAPTSQ